MSQTTIKTHFREIEGRSPLYLALLGGLLVLVGLGLLAAFMKGTYGHHITGMNNQVVWGLPHIFAILLIVAASGALNAASFASVFGRVVYKPLARVSALLAMTLLIGGLVILVLDLGRPDRLIVAMTHYNFKSIFAWNIFLYTGFLAIVAVYLWFMMEKRMNRYVPVAGYAAFLWRLILTTGTGSIFGFLVAREAYDAAILAPLFIAMSFSLGMAVFILVTLASFLGTGRPLGDLVLRRMKNLLGIFVAGVLYFVLVYHLTNLYATRLHGIEAFVLLHGGIYTFLFWFVQILIGSLIPLLLLFHPVWSQSRKVIAAASGLVLVGGFAQLYVIVVGGQAYPLELFPGYDMSSAFFDGVVAGYTPSLVEWMLGIGGTGFAFLLFAIALKFLRFLPTSLADDKVDPHAAGVSTATRPATAGA
ncbi:Sulfite reduction-associated complex DsrMKJOP protein DsrP (HmeB) [Thioalkalivibrio nitratireducens DSM 14787]|uniref:Sulfite reduction-associated complex DsrMKJOP protein DsrP (HmeB) n=1 Tax=Thioalkalivibrio nitratireducens (strain DSM 14787 / UNIQEM 213 / ALEN2) TaxID=1255043 RepID=L0DSE9_THIND|nr:NrfD/PsrC family molybdoenzyme membrane anchor subunit [Thioalkalivibrio nitratireducens]AGA32539.1 Sulfite reduction-associated complex DsrMKJOP protein DsrP (HmeB) [Thioalkalivibrio nitratireducens DSM 14787]